MCWRRSVKGKSKRKNSISGFNNILSDCVKKTYSIPFRKYPKKKSGVRLVIKFIVFYRRKEIRTRSSKNLSVLETRL